MASCSSPTQYARAQRLKELAGYVELIENNLTVHELHYREVSDLLAPILRLCELLVPQCGPTTSELEALQRRMGAIRLQLDHGFALEDTGECEVPR